MANGLDKDNYVGLLTTLAAFVESRGKKTGGVISWPVISTNPMALSEPRLLLTVRVTVNVPVKRNV